MIDIQLKEKQKLKNYLKKLEFWLNLPANILNNKYNYEKNINYFYIIFNIN